MKRGIYLLCIGFLTCSIVEGCKRVSREGSCLLNENIPEEVLGPLIDAGEKYIIHLEKDEINALYDGLSKESKKQQTREQFKALIEMNKKSFGTLEFSQLGEAYLIESPKAKRGGSVVIVRCNLGEEKMDDYYQVPPKRRIGVLLYQSKGEYETVHILLEMVEEEGQWKLLSIILNPLTAKKQLTGYYLEEARKLREENKLHLSAMYYKVGIMLSELGPNIDEFLVRLLTRELSQLKVDYMPMGMIQIWTMDSGNSYQVSDINPILAEGKLLINLDVILKSLDDKNALDKTADELLDFMFKRFPEYQEGFDGIVITAHSQDPARFYEVYQKARLFKTEDTKEKTKKEL